MGYVTSAYSCCRRGIEIPQDRKPFACGRTFMSCVGPKNTLNFFTFPSSGFDLFLQRETTIGIFLGSAQELACSPMFSGLCGFCGKKNSVGLSLLLFVLT